MYATCRWLAVALVALTVGCNKGPAAGTGTSASSVPAKVDTNVTADVAMTNLAKSMAAGDAGAVWNMLPTKYQSDVTGLKNEFAAKMDAEVWNKTFGVVGKIANVLKTKKEFILKSPAAAQAPPEAKEQIDKNWDSIVGVLSTLANSEIKTLDGLKAADPGKFLSSTGTQIATSAIKAAESGDPNAKAGLDKLRNTKFTLVKTEGDKATVKEEAPGEPAKEEVYVKVEGKWLPETMVKDWDAKIAEAKTNLGQMAIPPEQKTAVLGLITQIDGTVDKLGAAKDQAAFDQEIGMAFMQLLPVIGGLGGGGGAMSGPPGAMSGPPGGLPPTGAGGPTLTPSITPPLTPPITVPPVTTPPKP